MTDRISVGKIKGRHLLSTQKQKAIEAADKTLARYGIVTAVSGDRVAVREAGDSGAGGQLIAKAAIGAVVGTTGVLLPLAGGGDVFIPVGAAAASNFLPLTGGTLTGPLVIEDDAIDVFAIRDPSTSNLEIFSIDSDAWVTYFRGMTIIGRTTGDVEKFRIDAQTGLGTFANLNTPVWIWEVQDTPTDASNANNAVWDTNIEASISLPTGTWNVYALAIGAYTNASSTAVRQVTRVGASSMGASWQLTCGPSFPQTIGTIHMLGGQTGTVTCYGLYQPATNGNTANAKGGSMLIWAARTA